MYFYDSSSEAEETEYYVENILDRRTRNGKIEYFLKWENYDVSHNSWEPKENLNCDELIKDFEEGLRQEKKKNVPSCSHKHILSNSTVTSCASSDAVNDGEQSDVSEHTVNDNEKGASPEREAEKIICMTDKPFGQHSFLVKWHGMEKGDLIPARQANLMFPQLVLTYYEEKLTWHVSKKVLS